MPLFCLTGLQGVIRSGALREDDVWLATTDSGNDLWQMKWTIQDLLDFLGCLRPYRLNVEHDFHNAEWCKDTRGDWYPCDSYKMSYDKEQKCRDANGVSVFVKFSVSEEGDLTLVVISAHD